MNNQKFLTGQLHLLYISITFSFSLPSFYCLLLPSARVETHLTTQPALSPTLTCGSYSLNFFTISIVVTDQGTRKSFDPFVPASVAHISHRFQHPHYPFGPFLHNLRQHPVFSASTYNGKWILNFFFIYSISRENEQQYESARAKRLPRVSKHFVSCGTEMLPSWHLIIWKRNGLDAGQRLRNTPPFIGLWGLRFQPVLSCVFAGWWVARSIS